MAAVSSGGIAPRCHSLAGHSTTCSQPGAGRIHRCPTLLPSLLTGPLEALERSGNHRIAHLHSNDELQELAPFSERGARDVLRGLLPRASLRWPIFGRSSVAFFSEGASILRVPSWHSDLPGRGTSQMRQPPLGYGSSTSLYYPPHKRISGYKRACGLMDACISFVASAVRGYLLMRPLSYKT